MNIRPWYSPLVMTREDSGKVTVFGPAGDIVQVCNGIDEAEEVARIELEIMRCNGDID